MVYERFKGLQGKVLLGKLIGLLLFSLVFGYLIDKVVASVNGEPILESDVKMAELYYGMKDRKSILERLIEVNLIYQYMVSRGISIPDNKIDEILKDIARRNGLSVEELAKELKKYGLTLKDFKDFLRKDLIATVGLREYLLKQVSVTDVELELAKLKKGKVKVKKEIELLILPKEKGKELLNLLGSEVNLKGLSEKLGGAYQRLMVEKGELIKELDKQVWKAKKGELVFAEDDKNIYVVKILKTHTEVEGVDTEKLKEEILQKKLEEAYRKLLRELKENSVITIVER
ncbi:SurA N-terminal domain-containing protein [Aquifex pyrophilus]